MTMIKEYGKYKIRTDKFGNVEINDPTKDEYEFLDKDSLALEFIKLILNETEFFEV